MASYDDMEKKMNSQHKVILDFKEVLPQTVLTIVAVSVSLSIMYLNVKARLFFSNQLQVVSESIG